MDFPESCQKGFMRFVVSLPHLKKVNSTGGSRTAEFCMMEAGPMRVVLIFDLCSIHSLHLLNEQDFQ